MKIQTVQGAYGDKPANAVVSAKAGNPFGGSLTAGNWFHVVPSDTRLEWPAVQGRHWFSDEMALVQDCVRIEVHVPDSPEAQAIVAAWPNRVIRWRKVEA